MPKIRKLEPGLLPWRRFMGVAKHFEGMMDAFLQAETALSLSETYLLIYTRDAGGQLRLVDLAELLSLTRAGVTKMVDRLEERGLVGREASSTDRRAKHVVLKPEGLAQLRRTRPMLKRWIASRFLEHLTERQADQLNGAMLALIAGNGIDDPATRIELE